MSRVKKQVELTPDLIGINPFTPNLEIYTTKREYKVLNKFKEEDIKEVEYEATPYTKVFEVEGGKKQILELPIRSKEMYLYLIHAVKPAQDYIMIDREDYMAKMGIGSVNTFKAALKGLFEAAYLDKHNTIKDLYWINPHYFFKGNRLSKYPKNVKIKRHIK